MLKNLKLLAKKTERLVERMDRVGTTQGPRRTVAKAVRKETAIDVVLGIIRRSRKGVDAATLRSKTGFAGRKIFDIVHKLKKQGKIKSMGKGVYVKT
jgi:hypothetical protein